MVAKTIKQMRIKILQNENALQFEIIEYYILYQMLVECVYMRHHMTVLKVQPFSIWTEIQQTKTWFAWPSQRMDERPTAYTLSRCQHIVQVMQELRMLC